jgi:DNA-binding NarL/FixJ family response regulator
MAATDIPSETSENSPGKNANQPSRSQRIALEPDSLTPREAEVLKCIAEGQSTSELASKLGITFKTAACHRERIMQKTSAHNAVMLVRFAIRAGLIDP